MEPISRIHVTADETGSSPVLIVAGELTLETAEEFRHCLLERMKISPPAAVNLSAVTEADLSGLQLLQSARQTCGRSGVELRFEGMPEWLGQLAEAAGYQPQFQSRSPKEP